MIYTCTQNIHSIEMYLDTLTAYRLVIKKIKYIGCKIIIYTCTQNIHSIEMNVDTHTQHTGKWSRIENISTVRLLFTHALKLYTVLK